MNEAVRAVEGVARLSYGRLVARLAARTGSLADAEDALSEALARALDVWPRIGIPDNPEAWLIRTARNRAIDMARTGAVAAAHEPHLALLAEERAASGPPATDPRLPLLFVCAHPAIDPRLRAPLMLQTVLGLDARRMASVLLIAPGTLGQALTRVKARIERAAIPFALPEGADFDARMADVLEAVYGAYAVGYNALPAGDTKGASLAQEALWLASLLAEGFPRSAEAHALFAMILFSEARRPARADPATGALIPLGEQDTALWDAGMLADAERALRNAARCPTLGRFQIEASIQAVHAARRRRGVTDWDALALLYAGLVRIAPTVGARTAHAAVLCETAGPAAALSALDAIPERDRAAYQPWWATRAHAAARAGDVTAAVAAYDRAIGLSDDPSTRLHLSRKRSDLSPP